MEYITFPLLPWLLGSSVPILCRNLHLPHFYRIIPLLTYIWTFNSHLKGLLQLCFILFPLQTLWKGDEGKKKKKDSGKSGA